ncbi:MAG: tetratricopeptide repeat protein [Candidatus Electrothrix sp. LOE2]|nr:tetratricopeptide repeat protein [Candidatus Electrothrix sp. LOE2]
MEKEIQRRKNADEALAKLHGQLPPARLEEAAKLLQKGDTTAAERLFEEVVRKEGKDVALAAYQNGQLAEGRLDYAKAMRQYRKAVALEENNLDYLLAGAKMSRTMANYDQAQEWLEQLLSIKQQEGTADLFLSNILKELASLYYFRGFYEKSEKLYNRSLAIIEKRLGKEHPETATVLTDIAALYETQARYEDAESLYKRAQKIVGRPSKRIIPTRPVPQLQEKKTNIDSVAAKNSTGFSLSSFLSSLCFFCAKMPEQQRMYAEATGIGTGLGAGIGAVACSDNRAACAAGGGLLGGVTGYAVGGWQVNQIGQMDQQNDHRAATVNYLQQYNARMSSYNYQLGRQIAQYERNIRRNIHDREGVRMNLTTAQNERNKLQSVVTQGRQEIGRMSDPNQRRAYQSQLRQLEREVQKLDGSIRRLQNLSHGRAE